LRSDPGDFKWFGVPNLRGACEPETVNGQPANALIMDRPGSTSFIDTQKRPSLHESGRAWFVGNGEKCGQTASLAVGGIPELLLEVLHGGC
jgi:hypothetical protein